MQQLLKNFKYSNKKIIEEKINLLISGGKKKLHIVSDFDRTLTVGKEKGGGDSSTWAVLEKHLPDKLKQKSLDLYNFYRPLEIAGKLSSNDAVFWWEEAIKILINGRKLPKMLKFICQPGMKLKNFLKYVIKTKYPF